jgi:hypothetical protein
MNAQDRTPGPRVKTAHIVTFAFCTAVMAILCTAAGFLFAVIPGLPLGFCPAVPVMVPFALWFGGWGVAATYIGCAIGGIIKGTPVIVALPWVINDVFLAGIPLLAFRLFKADPELNARRDWVIFFVFGVVINTLIACTWGTWIPVVFGIWPSGAVPVIWAQYVVACVLLLIFITPPILKRFTGPARRTGAYTKGFLA